MTDLPCTREELIETHLSDDDIVEIIHALRQRVERYGDVQAAKLLLEFKYGRNPEPPSSNTTLEELMLTSPTSTAPLSTE